MSTENSSRNSGSNSSGSGGTESEDRTPEPLEHPWRLVVSGDLAEADGTTMYGDIGLDQLAAAGVDWRVAGSEEEGLRAEDLADADAVLLLGQLPITAENLEGTSLRHVARFGAGYDKVDLAACEERGIIVTNAPRALREPMAHTALTLLFALAHNLLPKDHLVREGTWEKKSQLHGHGLLRATIGVVGLGGIGQQTVRLLRALGLDVVAWNRSPRPEFCAETGIEQVELEDLLRRCDYVVLTVAAAPETHHLIGAPELTALGPHGYLVNIARGSVVDEQALIAALQDGTIAGAGLDVFETEPLPTSSPLIGLENVVITPHSLCWTEDFVAASSAEVRGEILAVARGQEPQNPVNSPRG